MTAPERDLHSELERAILGENPSLTSEQVSSTSGMEPADAERLWRALGFPDATHGERAFTTGDIDALCEIKAAVDSGGLDLDTVVRMTRAVGRTVARLAEWEVAMLTGLTSPLPNGETGSSADGSRLPAAIAMVDRLGPSFEQLLVYSWRRHLAAAVARVEELGADDEDLQVASATVGFADLVGFSALTNELEDDAIGDLVEVFENRSQDVVAGHRGRIIKSLGDSVLFLGGSAEESVEVALDIVAVIGGDSRLPDVRVGLASGPVVLRMGDVYGPAVNLAARLTAVARRNRVIADQRTAALLRVEQFETRVLPARPVRGFGDIEPVAVRRTRSPHDF